MENWKYISSSRVGKTFLCAEWNKGLIKEKLNIIFLNKETTLKGKKRLDKYFPKHELQRLK